MYIDIGSSVPGVPSKSRDLANENNKLLTEWKLFETTVLENISNFSAIIVFHCDSLAKISHLKTYFPIFFVFFFSTLFCITYYWTCDKIDNFIFLVYYYVFLGPPPVTSPGKPRRDSDNSNHSQEVFSGGEDVKDEPRSPVSPAHRDESAAKLIPAPPPVVNVWEKRKTETVVKTAVVSVKSPMEAHTHVKSETRSIADAPVCLFYYYYFFNKLYFGHIFSSPDQLSVHRLSNVRPLTFHILINSSEATGPI